MNPQDPLANLHPLREPEVIGWWPLAPGWWIVIGLIALALTALAFVLYRKYAANAYRRQATQQLQNIHTQWLADGDSQVYAAEVNALLKSVAIHAFPSRDVASYNGSKWLQFLNGGLATQGLSFPESFANSAYQKQVPSSQCQQYLEPARRWINHHKVVQ